MSKEKTLARINQVDILAIEEKEENLIPIRPMCDAIGIDFSAQLKKIKEHSILGPTMVLNTTVANDGNKREMQCLPYKWIFGWLLTIDHRNVKPEIQDAVLRYQLECYEVLYRHNFEEKKFMKEKEDAIETKLSEIKNIKKNFKNTKEALATAEKQLLQIRNFTYDDYRANNSQLEFSFWKDVQTVKNEEETSNE